MAVRKGRKVAAILILLTGFIPALALAQQSVINIASSPNPVGSGARALGMGGAFIAVADDATAASWNPGGLTQLETPEVSLVQAYNQRREDTTYQLFPDASGPQDTSNFEINYFSLAYPFTAFRKNMTVSLNYQKLFDFTKKVVYGVALNDPSLPFIFQDHINWEQKGGLNTISPAYAIQLLPQLSAGFTLNFWDKKISYWKTKYHSTGQGQLTGFDFVEETDLQERWDFRGFNYNLGILWNIDKTFTLGAVFKSPFRAKLAHKFNFLSDLTFPAFPPADSHNAIELTDRQTLDMPMSYGVGLGIRMSDELTFDLDVYRTQWDDFVRRTEDGQQWNPLTGLPREISKVKPTNQVRFGGEYLVIRKKTVIPLRAGIFYDPEPSENHPDDFWGFSIGSGFVYNKLVYDIAYQFRFANNVRGTTVGNEASSQDVSQHTIFMSVIYHF